MIRLWLLPQGPDARQSVILTGEHLVSQDIHPLRCIYLGRFASADDPAAIAKARQLARAPESVLAHNVRIACDRRQTKRWRLSEQEIDLLVAGEILHLKDGLGTFAVGYSRLE